MLNVEKLLFLSYLDNDEFKLISNKKQSSLSLFSGKRNELKTDSYVYAVLPFYDVKCLCTGGREWGREESHSH